MIYFFYGEEDFLVDLETKKMKTKFLAQNSKVDLRLFDFSIETNLQNLTESLSEQSLFSAKKIVIINDFFSNTKAEQQNDLLEILKNNDFQDNIIIFSENGQPRKNAKLFKFLEEKADKVQNFVKLENKKLLDWIVKRTKELASEISLSEKVANELVFLLGNDLRKLDLELQKLVNFAEKEISKEDLQKLVVAKIEGDIFQTIELAFQKNKQQALFLLKKQLAKGDDPFYIFSMYIYQIRVLLKIAGCLDKNQFANEFSISKETKLHPFVVKKALSLAKKFSLKSLIKAHHFLLELDKDLKLGKREILSALDLFVMSV